jgi:hypothetical protein
MLCGAGTGSRSSGKKRVWEMRQSRTGTGALVHLPGLGGGGKRGGGGGIGDFSRWWFSIVNKNLFWGVGTEARVKEPQLGVVDG